MSSRRNDEQADRSRKKCWIWKRPDGGRPRSTRLEWVREVSLIESLETPLVVVFTIFTINKNHPAWLSCSGKHALSPSAARRDTARYSWIYQVHTLTNRSPRSDTRTHRQTHVQNPRVGLSYSILARRPYSSNKTVQKLARRSCG